MQIYFAPDITGEYCVIDENESKHAIRVLRLTGGDNIKLVDGKGNLYEGIIVDPDPKGCSVRITGVMHDFEKRDYKLAIAISPLKNHERFEWFIEKSVEIGIDEIIPVICRNTEKSGLRMERLNNIIVSAMKQSIKAIKPVLIDPVAFPDFIFSRFPGIRMIAHCNPEIKRVRIDQVYAKGQEVIVVIGPEGDFSKDEIGIALDNGFHSVHLGSSRLRAETAALAACHSVYFINQ